MSISKIRQKQSRNNIFKTVILMSSSFLSRSRAHKTCRHRHRINGHAPFVTAPLNRTSSASHGGGGEEKHPKVREKRLTTRPDCSPVTSRDRGTARDTGENCTFVPSPPYRKWPDGFVTAGADRESRLNWFNLWPQKGVTTALDLICSQDQNSVTGPCSLREEIAWLLFWHYDSSTFPLVKEKLPLFFKI